MANYSENKIVFFSEDKKAIYDLWQNIYSYYINEGNSNSFYNFLIKMGYKINEVKQMTDLRNVFVDCDSAVTEAEYESYFYIETETAWSANLEIFYDIIRDKYDNKIHTYAMIEECGFGIFINTDIEGVFLPNRYKLDCLVDGEEIEKYFESFKQLKAFVQKKFTKIKLLLRDDSEIITKKIIKAYQPKDDDDFYFAIYHFGTEYPF